MPRIKKTITDYMILEVFQAYQIDVQRPGALSSLKPYQRLMYRSKCNKTECLAACERAVSQGLINRPGPSVTLEELADADELITPKGRRMLELPNMSNRRQKKPKGPDLLIHGWVWK